MFDNLATRRTVWVSTLKNYVRDYIKPDQISAIPLSVSDIAIDCGANIGSVTHRLAHKGATVYAFEPNPSAYAVLQKRFKRSPNVHCFNKAVLDRDDTLKLYLHQLATDNQVKWSVGSSLIAEKSNVNVATFVEVEAVDLADFIDSLGKQVKVLKLDVEGAEYDILHRLIDSGVIYQIDHVIAEIHNIQTPVLLERADALYEKIEGLNLQQIDLNWV